MSTRAVRIRPGAPREATLLSQLAHAAKASWGYPAEWLAEWTDELTISPAFVELNPVFVAEESDVDGASRISGFVGLENGVDGPEIAHLWVLPDSQGRGIGRALVERALEDARERGWEELRILSDPNAVEFYVRLGAVRTGSFPAPVAGMPRELPVLTLATDIL